MAEKKKYWVELYIDGKESSGFAEIEPDGKRIYNLKVAVMNVFQNTLKNQDAAGLQVYSAGFEPNKDFGNEGDKKNDRKAHLLNPMVDIPGDYIDGGKDRTKIFVVVAPAPVEQKVATQDQGDEVEELKALLANSKQTIKSLHDNLLGVYLSSMNRNEMPSDFSPSETNQVEAVDSKQGEC